ncbi:MAG: hypothetical protein RMY34_01295 [Aulosira sp. DedQUE10]|nr:hypothetical protein [Aulosira sp. DedQUE10]
MKGFKGVNNKECPIGLICEFFECDRDYCFELVEPWKLPYEIYDFGHPESRKLIVGIPEYEEYGYSNCDAILERTNRYNEWVGRVRDNLWLGGWWNAVDLPYEFHPSGGLMVTKHLRLDGLVNFTSCLVFANGFRRDKVCWEGFYPAVPVNGYELYFHEKPPTFKEEDFVDAFCEDNYILLKNNFSLLFIDIFL